MNADDARAAAQYFAEAARLADAGCALLRPDDPVTEPRAYAEVRQHLESAAAALGHAPRVLELIA